MKINDVVETSRGTGHIVFLLSYPDEYSYLDEVRVVYDSGRSYTYHPNALRLEVERRERQPLRAP